MKIIIMYNYVEEMGGTDNGIHFTCPKCKSEEVIIVVLEEGNYGVEECKKCGYKNQDIHAHLNGKKH